MNQLCGEKPLDDEAWQVLEETRAALVDQLGFIETILAKRPLKEGSVSPILPAACQEKSK